MAWSPRDVQALLLPGSPPWVLEVAWMPGREDGPDSLTQVYLSDLSLS